MGYDLKYLRVTTERGDIGDDEILFLLRGQDRLLLQVLQFYLELCTQEGSPERHLTSIKSSMRAVKEWQEEHFTKTPSSDALAHAGSEPIAGDEYNGFTLNAYSIPDDTAYVYVELRRDNIVVKEFLYPTYQIWTLIAHWRESNEVNQGPEEDL